MADERVNLPVEETLDDLRRDAKAVESGKKQTIAERIAKVRGIVFARLEKGLPVRVTDEHRELGLEGEILSYARKKEREMAFMALLNRDSEESLTSREWPFS